MIHDATGRKLALRRAGRRARRSCRCRTRSRSRIPKDFTLIGTPAKRLDTPGQGRTARRSSASTRKLPGMKIATVAACPVFGGKLASVDDSKAKAIPGVRQVVGSTMPWRWSPTTCGPPSRAWRRSTSGGTRARTRRSHAPTSCDRLDAASAEPGVGRPQGRRCRQGAGRRRDEGRGGLPGAVPRACADGADELHGPCARRTAASLGRHPGLEPRPGDGRRR